MNSVPEILIVGCGDMGQAHATAWSLRSDVQLQGVFDPDHSRAASMAEQFGCALYSDFDLALSNQQVDIVSVCTPVCYHSYYAIAAAEAGKHVLCEKPIALEMKDAIRMQEACERAGVILSVSYQYRGWPQYQKVKELVQAGRLAGPLFLRFLDVREVRPKLAMHRKAMNGGPIIDMAGHFFDLMRFFTGCEPTGVFARGHTFGKNKDRLSGLDDPAVDAADILVSYEQGHTLNACIHWGLPECSMPKMNAEILSQDALLDLNDAECLRFSSAGELKEIPLEPSDRGPGYSINCFLNAIRQQSPEFVSAKDGTVALAVSFAALRSIETGDFVAIDEIR